MPDDFSVGRRVRLPHLSLLSDSPSFLAKSVPDIMAPRKKVTPPAPTPEVKLPTPKRAGSAKARRSAARLNAVQALYQIELTESSPEVIITEYANFRLGQELDGDRYVSADGELFAAIVRGATSRQHEIDPVLSQALDRQHLDRLELLLRAILRAGAWELLAGGDTAARIVINDYIDVAHGFFAGREPGMINGVLDKVARIVRPDELASRAGGQEGAQG
ncbi:NusB antitermination factor [Nitrospirillum amazonense]|uniref:Transcription antitermination protein NusB n=2 Tax=Nitrospirillum amazonense TaxID=28077 RepID=A0A560FKI5_9PROT|nr:NusB antitermination factor [Nitrospirillum amazonense]